MNSSRRRVGGLERDQFGQALDRLGRMRAELAQRAARRGGQAVDAPPAQHRRARRIGQERQQRERQRPGDHAPAPPARRPGSAPRRTPGATVWA